MVLTSDEAKKHQCCSMQKMCEGSECMAWRIFYQADKQSLANNFPIPPIRRVTDKGYCGLAHK